MARPEPTITSRCRSLLVPALLVLAFLALGARRGQDAARVDRLEIVMNGVVVAEVSADGHGGVIRLLDRAGRDAASLRATAGGGAELVLNDALGERAFMLRSGGPSPRIVAGPADRERVIFDAAAPLPDDNSVRVLAVTVDDLTDEVRNLASRHDDLERDVRDLQPGRSTTSHFDRLLRNIDEVRREQDDLERDLRQLSDENSRRRSDVSSLERRIARLESRIRE